MQSWHANNIVWSEHFCVSRTTEQRTKTNQSVMKHLDKIWKLWVASVWQRLAATVNTIRSRPIGCGFEARYHIPFCSFQEVRRSKWFFFIPIIINCKHARKRHNKWLQHLLWCHSPRAMSWKEFTRRKLCCLLPTTILWPGSQQHLVFCICEDRVRESRGKESLHPCWDKFIRLASRVLL